jgi:hypothetical protein
MSMVRIVSVGLSLLALSSAADGAELIPTHKHIAHVRVYKTVAPHKSCLTGWWRVYYQNSYQPRWATRCYFTVAER